MTRDSGQRKSVSVLGQRACLPEINGGTTSRWNPTPEQIVALEEMYSKGVRTPSADQIQHIAIELRKFGKIEGKNVFYWFQNHKARERQKRRRECDDHAEKQTLGDRMSMSTSSLMPRPERVQRRAWSHFPTRAPQLHCTPATCQNGYSSPLFALKGSHESELKEAQIQTLQLFPLQKENEDKDKEAARAPINTPRQFIEFLPLKN